MGRIERINEVIQGHDYKLYCERHVTGVLCVYRKGDRVESYEIDGDVIHFIRPCPHFVFALTHDWSLNGRPVEWGTLPIAKRLHDIDLWKRDLVSDIERNDEKRRESEARELQNQNEAFLKDHRSIFKKAFDDVNTANMEKVDKRRSYEKRIKQL
jgi:hypothetical protein